MKNCSQCRFAVFQDYGYSNYTVEGTEFSCAKKVHPDGEFDRFYGENRKLDFADKCGSFVAGECIDMDCDHEGISELSAEQKEVWIMDGN